MIISNASKVIPYFARFKIVFLFGDVENLRIKKKTNVFVSPPPEWQHL